MSKDTKYLQFPLSLMQNFFIDTKATMNQILDAGIYHLSTNPKFNSDALAAGTHLLFTYYRHTDHLTHDLEKYLSKLYDDNHLDYDNEYNGFVGNDGFKPNELGDLLNIMQGDPELTKIILEYHKIHKVMHFLKITGNTGMILINGKSIKNTSKAGEPWPMINRDLAFDFLKNDKDQWSKIQFAGYVAVGSIIGKASYKKTNYNLIRARMFGYNKFADIPETLPPLVKELLVKYSFKYWMDKLLRQLELKWEIQTYSRYMRGIIIGKSDKITMDAMVLAAEKSKLSTQINELKQRKENALEKALQQLNKEQQQKNKELDF